MNDRTTASVLTRHIGVLSHFVGRLQEGVAVVPTWGELMDLGNLAGALNAAVVNPTPQPDPIPPPMPPAPPGAPWDYPIVMAEAMWGGQRDGWMDTRAVTCVPIPVPMVPTDYASPWLDLRIAEYRSPASNKEVSLSRSPGDFTFALAYGFGNTATASVSVGKSELVKPGDLIYFNVRFWSADLNKPSTDEPTAGVVYNGGWPR